MKKFHFVLIAIIAFSASFGTATALIHNETVQVKGELQVFRDTGPSAITVQNDQGFSNAIKLWDADDGQIYQFRLIGTGDRIDLIDITNNRLGFSMLSSNGNVGINNGAPSEKLDVNGNIKLSGNILSNGDICIGTCP